ncbi:hypothetical protein A2U01_0115783, partial [Trifolium medium]|nr:hypothetical protein [Trifolium medium]
MRKVMRSQSGELGQENLRELVVEEAKGMMIRRRIEIRELDYII